MCFDVCWDCMRNRKGMRKESHIIVTFHAKFLNQGLKNIRLKDAGILLRKRC